LKVWVASLNELIPDSSPGDSNPCISCGDEPWAFCVWNVAKCASVFNSLCVSSVTWLGSNSGGGSCTASGENFVAMSRVIDGGGLRLTSEGW